MASIPLPALHLNPPPQQENPVEQYGRILQLKNMMAMQPLQQQAMQQQVQAGKLENQQKQQSLKDQQAATAAMQEWDGKDINQLPTLMIKKGASAQAVMGLKSKALEMQQTYSKIAADDATTGAKTIETKMKKNDMVGGAFSTVLGLPDEQLPQAIISKAQELAQQGLLDPQHVQMAQQIAQQPPAQARQALDTMRKGMLADSQLLEQAKLQAQTAAEKATGEKTALENEQIKQYGGLTGPAQDAKYQFLQKKVALGQPLSQDDKAWMTGYQKQKLLVPVTTANIRMEGMGQLREYPVYDKQQGATVMVTPNEINRAAKEQPGRYTAASYTPESVGAKDTTQYFTKGKGGQQLTAFNTAMEHLDTLQKLGADLNNTDLQIANKAKQAWAQETGNPAPANFAAAKNAMAGEVAAALKASGATDQEITKVSETFDRSQSPAQLNGAINTYRSLLKTKASNLQKQYEQGMHGRPNFETQSGGLTVTAPNGKVYTFKDQASADAFKQKAGIQ